MKKLNPITNNNVKNAYPSPNKKTIIRNLDNNDSINLNNLNPIANNIVKNSNSNDTSKIVNNKIFNKRINKEFDKIELKNIKNVRNSKSNYSKKLLVLNRRASLKNVKNDKLIKIICKNRCLNKNGNITTQNLNKNTYIKHSKSCKKNENEKKTKKISSIYSKMQKFRLRDEKFSFHNNILEINKKFISK